MHILDANQQQTQTIESIAIFYCNTRIQSDRAHMNETVTTTVEKRLKLYDVPYGLAVKHSHSMLCAVLYVIVVSGGGGSGSNDGAANITTLTVSVYICGPPSQSKHAHMMSKCVIVITFAIYSIHGVCVHR